MIQPAVGLLREGGLSVWLCQRPPQPVLSTSTAYLDAVCGPRWVYSDAG